MVEYYIKNDFNSIFIQGLYEFFQLQPFLIVFDLGSIAGIRRKKAYRVIAPVIQQLPAVYLSAPFISSNSKIGISSTALIPSSFRYGIFSIRPAKVPGLCTPEEECLVKPLTCSS